MLRGTHPRCFRPFLGAEANPGLQDGPVGSSLWVSPLVPSPYYGTEVLNKGPCGGSGLRHVTSERASEQARGRCPANGRGGQPGCLVATIKRTGGPSAGQGLSRGEKFSSGSAVEKLHLPSLQHLEETVVCGAGRAAGWARAARPSWAGWWVGAGDVEETALSE